MEPVFSYNIAMLRKTAPYIKLTEEIRSQLVSERNRTGLSSAIIIRYAKTMGILPGDTKLTSAIINTWLSGRAGHAEEPFIEAILRAYRTIVPECELTVPPCGEHLLVIDDILQEELLTLLDQRRNSSRRLILKRNDAPKGLNESRLKRLSNRRDDLILASHLSFIREHFTR